MKTEEGIKRIRWVMVFTLLSDTAITLLGQPASYWRDPATVVEGNHLMRSVFSQGIIPTLFFLVLSLYGLSYLVSILPKKLALTIILFFTLSGYFGISSWLYTRFHMGSSGEIICAFVIAVILVLAGLDVRHEIPSTDKA